MKIFINRSSVFERMDVRIIGLKSFGVACLNLPALGMKMTLLLSRLTYVSTVEASSKNLC